MRLIGNAARSIANRNTGAAPAASSGGGGGANEASRLLSDVAARQFWEKFFAAVMNSTMGLSHKYLFLPLHFSI